jgi:subtilase family serine protease
LAACGGGSPAQIGGKGSSADALAVATAGTASSDPALPEVAALPALTASPAFHLAPVELDAPSSIDADGTGSSAGLAPHAQRVPESLQGLRTAGLTPERIAESERPTSEHPNASARDPRANAAGGGSAVQVYTPAQIRRAYGLPALPAPGTRLTAAQAAALGSGQTIYLIDAHDNPNAYSDLANFSATFGLPSCTNVPIGTATALPLAVPAAGSGCTFSTVYIGSNGQLANHAPSYDAGWATEIAIDVQWAHATAPLARLVLVEAQEATLAQLAAGIRMAGTMGPGIVSMSFGLAEGPWVGSLDFLFPASGKSSFVASAGDSGAGVNWPAVSPNVLAVGGTTLVLTGGGPRSETVWSLTGGGISAYEVQGAYQRSLTIPGEPGVQSGTHLTAMRSVSDVAFNADPSTGQYVVITAPGSSAHGWYSGGGTSMGAPQWAGLLAIANAQRAQLALPPLAPPQAMLYQRIAAVNGRYASAFLDVTQGSDGACATCSAGPGYDQPTGLGTPNAGNLLALMTGS